MSKKATYKEAGVDIKKGSRSVKEIKRYVSSTFNRQVLSDLTTFGGIYDLGELIKEYDHPVLVQSIDSVGTKLIIANLIGRHTTIGLDLVAHSCNDILCQGARPVTFLDYIAVERLKPKQIAEIIQGLCQGCREAGIALIGGEMAELPGIYLPLEYDLVGAITGVVEREKIIEGKKITPGDKLLGLASSGLHTNGYSLVRRIFFELKNYSLKKYFPELKKSLGEELLIPHYNYSPLILPLLKEFSLKGIAHITGGGLPDNLSRILPDNCQALIKKGSWEILPIFDLIKREGSVSQREMQRIFNLGIGLVLVVSENDLSPLSDLIRKKGVKTYHLGEIVSGKKGVRFE